jgi:hypothetical protein
MKVSLPFFCFQFILTISMSAQQEFPQLEAGEDSALKIDLSTKPLVKDNKIVLQWRCSGFEKDGFCIIERSSDQKSFEVLGVLKTRGSVESFEFADEQPAHEKNYYRIKIGRPGGKVSFSKTISADRTGSFFFKFYPNPVDNALIIRSQYAAKLQIIDGSGNTRINHDLNAGLQTVDVSFLPKGLYILSISVANKQISITKKLLKN